MPVTLAKKLEATRTRFFWGGSDTERKLAWIEWGAVLAPKDMGGLDVGSLVSFNLSLVMKWKWRFFTSEDTLWVRVIRILYGEKGGFFSLRRQASGFSPWARLLAADAKLQEQEIIKEEVLERRVGDGKNIRFWKDVWVGPCTLESRFPRLARRDSNPHCWVAERWFDGGWRWSWASPILRGVAFGQVQQLEELLKEVSCKDMKDG
ncbi:hypothetical protein LXL04_027527 [Taraxacum kok-saghyz]